MVLNAEMRNSQGPAAKNVLLVGTGAMALEYGKLLQGEGIGFSVLGRSREKVQDFAGAREWLLLAELKEGVKAPAYDAAIICTSPDSLAEVTQMVLDRGLARNFLVEKPCGMSSAEVRRLAQRLEAGSARALAALNRRFYASVAELKARLARERVLSTHFEFTELSDRVGSLDRAPIVKARWGLVNPIHVVDTVKFLVGELELDRVVVSGQGKLAWHPSGALFLGSGWAKQGGQKIPFTYHSNWLSAGRWQIDVMTEAARYRLAPFEALQMQARGTFNWADVPLDDADDRRYKPGLKRMLDSAWGAFFAGQPTELPGLSAIAEDLAQLEKIMGYGGGHET